MEIHILSLNNWSPLLARVCFSLFSSDVTLCTLFKSDSVKAGVTSAQCDPSPSLYNSPFIADVAKRWCVIHPTPSPMWPQTSDWVDQAANQGLEWLLGSFHNLRSRNSSFRTEPQPFSSVKRLILSMKSCKVSKLHMSLTKSVYLQDIYVKCLLRICYVVYIVGEDFKSQKVIC